MDDSNSLPKAKPKKLRRLSQSTQRSPEEQQPEQKRAKSKKPSKPKKDSKPKDNGERKQAGKRKKRKASVEVIVEEKSSSQAYQQADVMLPESNKPIQKDKDGKASLYKSSESSGEEENVGFVGLKEAEKKTRQSRPKREKKEIRTSNRFFKDENFDRKASYSTDEVEITEAQRMELHIEIKAVQPTKTMEFFKNKKSVAARKQKPNGEDSGTNSQDGLNKGSIKERELKRMILNDGKAVDEFDIELQVPRINAGKKNQIVDNTLFVKRFADGPKAADGTVSIQEKVKIKKKVSRDEYLREIDENIKNRRAQSISSQEICASFVMSSLDDLKVSKQLLIDNNEVSNRQASKGTFSQEASRGPAKRESRQVQKPRQSPREEQVGDALEPRQRSQMGIKPMLQTGNVHQQSKGPGQQNESREVSKKQQILKPEPVAKKPKPLNPLLKYFEDEAEESGRENLSGSEGEDGQLADLINDEVEYDDKYENLAYQKFMDDEFKRDEEMIKRITTKQYKIKKRFVAEQSANESRKTRMQDIKDMVKKREEELDEGVCQQPPPFAAEQEQEPEAQVDLSSQIRMELAAKKGSACRWSFAQPKKAINAAPPKGKRNSLLSVSTMNNAITNFKDKKKEPRPIGATLSQITRTSSK